MVFYEFFDILCANQLKIEVEEYVTTIENIMEKDEDLGEKIILGLLSNNNEEIVESIKLFNDLKINYEKNNHKPNN